MSARNIAGVLVIGCAILAGCKEPGTALPAPGSSSPAPTTDSSTPAPTSSSAPPASTAPSTPPASPRPAPQPAPGRCAGFPGPACTGVPAGTALRAHAGNLFVKSPGAVVEGVHVTGDLIVQANGVTILNSRIDGQVTNYDGSDGAHPFTIRDSTVGTETCKSTGTAIGNGHFTAERVHIRGFGDGIRASAPNVTVRDSFLKLCTHDPESHSDGIQDYPASANLVFDHNTVDQCGGRVPTNGVCDLKIGYNAPIFVHSNTNGGTKGARITNNLIMGGVYSLFLWPQPGNAWIVTGNRVVNGTWTYGPAHVEGLCGEIDQWSDNLAVTIDAAYKVTGTVKPIPCPA
jgi:hypothetical protein